MLRGTHRPHPFPARFLHARAAAACKEEGGVKVSSFTFNGTKAVTPAQLKSVLATSASSKLPWGTKHYFSRDQFDADLKRIVAFYKDRGYPDARVTTLRRETEPGPDVGRASPSTSTKGQPVSVERVVFDGFEPLAGTASDSARERSLPLKAGQPLDRALLQASREAALDELRDHGYPYASVRIAESDGSSDQRAWCRSSPIPGPLAHFRSHRGQRQRRRRATTSSGGS